MSTAANVGGRGAPGDPILPQERRVLVVLPHPDDETFGCGGSIALYARAGVPVTCLCATLGQLGRNMGRPPVATRESLPAVRERELRDACRILGVADLRLLRLFDKTLEFLDPAELAARIGAVVAETEPSLVYTFHPEQGGHPDHNATGAATLRAVASLPPGRRPRLRALIHPARAEKLGIATQSVDVSPVADVKLAALRAHASQTQGLLQRLNEKPDDPMWRLLREEHYVRLEP